MELNLVRLVFQIKAAASASISSVFSFGGKNIEESLAPLCTRGLSSDQEMLRRHQKPALPFVFDIPVQNGDFSVINLLLAGPSISHIPLFCNTIEKMPGQFQISAIHALNYQGEAIRIDTDGGDDLPVLSSATLLDMETPRFASCSGIRLDIKTSVRIVSAGRELTRFEPVLFVRSLLRRLSSLAAYYGVGADVETVRRLAVIAGQLEARQLERENCFPARRGVSGSYELHGPLEELGPLLALGSLFHLGKGASFGMGSFVVTPLSRT